MLNVLKCFLIAVSFFILSACGGGSSDNNNSLSDNNTSVNLKDKVAPIITLKGDDNMTLYINKTYTEPGAIAIDDRDGNLTDRITITGNVNTSKIGTYTLTYTVKDKAGNETSIIRLINIVGEKTLVFLNDIEHGLEPWITDGTAQGTKLLKDTELKYKASNPKNFTKVNEDIFFIANDSYHGNELWKTDGTNEGTVLVKDIHKGIDSSYPQHLVSYKGMLYFEANDGNGVALWKSDGTTEGTVKVKDIAVDSNIIVVNNIMFFEGKNEERGRELWKSNGTSEGTVLVKDITVGKNSSSIGDMVDFNGVLFFEANDKLWKSDGTDEGTKIVGNLPSMKYPYCSHLTYADNFLYFRYGDDLWKTDGTDNGTVLVKDMSSINAYWLSELTYIDGILYFSLTTDNDGTNLWKSDGTSEGTVMVKNVRSPRTLTKVNKTLFFTTSSCHNADGGCDGHELWKSDGTEEGTVKVKDIHQGTGSMYFYHIVNINGILYFQAANDTDGYALWRSDGTEEGTYMVKDINPDTQTNGGGDYKYIKNLTNINNTLYFSADDSIHGFELWKSDGTDEGTLLVKNINTTNLGRFYRKFYYGNSNIVKNNSLYYFTDDFGKLWKSDGTEDGTSLLKLDLEGWVADYFRIIGNELYFVNYLIEYHPEFWKTDGTEEGTIKLENNTYYIDKINESLFYTKYANNQHELWVENSQGKTLLKTTDSYIGHRLKFKNQLFFNIESNGHNELWKSDGTKEGTVKIKDLPMNYLDSIVNTENLIYILMHNKDNNYELWTSDGTEKGTSKIKELPNGMYSYGLHKTKNKVYFKNRNELWASDGTENGTLMLANEINIHNFDKVKNIGNTLYFNAYDSEHGSELWVSDGTVSGTKMLKDALVGSNGSYPSKLTVVKDILFYIAYGSDDNSYELWKSDGTEDGTIKLKTIVSDIDNYEFETDNIIMYGNLNNELLLSFYNYDMDKSELWKSNGTIDGTVRINYE